MNCKYCGCELVKREEAGEVCHMCEIEPAHRKPKIAPSERHQQEKHGVHDTVLATTPAMLGSIEGTSRTPTGKIAPGIILWLGVIGFVAGGSIGFLSRPSFFGAQMPFGIVLTRGAFLKGVDVMFIPLAQQSFNNTLMAAIIGTAIGVAIAYLGKKLSRG